MTVPHIYAIQETEEELVIWADLLVTCYSLWGDKLVAGGGSRIPTRMTFSRHGDAGWTLQEYLEPGDGTYYSPDIRAYCEGVPGLAERILAGPPGSIFPRMKEFLKKYLAGNGMEGVYWEEL